jgi:hypothetical protein
LCIGAAGAVVVAVVVIVEVIVEVGTDSTGFGASCFLHPATTNAATTIATAMIANIFFMLVHPLSFI